MLVHRATAVSHRADRSLRSTGRARHLLRSQRAPFDQERARRGRARHARVGRAPAQTHATPETASRRQSSLLPVVSAGAPTSSIALTRANAVCPPSVRPDVRLLDRFRRRATHNRPVPRLSTFYGIVIWRIVIWMYRPDHPPPHFHAQYGEDVAQIELGTLRVLAGSLPPRALRLVRQWARLHTHELTELGARSAA